MSNDELVKSKLKDIAKMVDNELPKGFGFVVLSFKFNATPYASEMMYVSNANREDVVQAMEEWIEKTKDSYGNDTGKIKELKKIKLLDPEVSYFKDRTELVYKLMYDKINEIAMTVNKIMEEKE